MMKKTVPAEGFLFDCDGVLVDSLEAAAIAWDAWAERYSPGYDFRTQIEHGVRAYEVVATLVSPQLFSEAIIALEAEELAGADRTSAIPGAVELTSSIHLTKWAVVTSGVRSLAKARLTAAGHRSPGVLVTAEDVQVGKPHRDPYAQGAAGLGVDPSLCVAFEDAPAGVQSARAAGVGFIVGVGDHLDDSKVDAHVPDLTHVAFHQGHLTIEEPDRKAR